MDGPSKAKPEPSRNLAGEAEELNDISTEALGTNPDAPEREVGWDKDSGEKQELSLLQRLGREMRALTPAKIQERNRSSHSGSCLFSSEQTSADFINMTKQKQVFRGNPFSALPILMQYRADECRDLYIGETKDPLHK